MNSKYLHNCPKHIAVFGGGRWARVLIQTVCRIVPEITKVSIFSPKNAKTMSIWVLEKHFKQNVYIHSDFSHLNIQKINVAIIANAARDHESIIEKSLQAGIDVLVEKPATLSYTSTAKLVKLANIKNILFSSAHIFLFARYTDNFSRLVTNSKQIKSIYVIWTDPKVEKRYGENKQYDQGLPIIYDWLPHILSIISTFTKNSPITGINVDLCKGGSYVKIKFLLGNIFCKLKLVRNDKIRRREFKVTTNQLLKLDFSKEPGVMHEGEKTICADEKWNVEERPAAQMITTFLNQAITGHIDNRLNIDIALRANKFIDNVAIFYNQALLSWLKTRLLSQTLIDIDLNYALSEIIFFKGHNPPNIEICIKNIKQAFNGVDAQKWQDKFSKSKKPFNVIRSSSRIKPH